MSAQFDSSLRLRRERAAFLRRLAWGSHHDACQVCAEILEDPPEVVAGMLTHELLETCFGVGPDLADAWQCAVGLFAAVTVAELKPKQRAGLIALLRFVTPTARVERWTSRGSVS